MTKDEIFKHVLWLTDSMFERFVENGVITTISKGKGKGRGRGTEKATYADNTIDVLRMVERLENSVKREDLVYALLWRGYEIDFQKLHERLFLDFDRFRAYLGEIGALSDDTDLLKKAAKNQLYPYKPGRPSNAENELIEKETESIRRHYKLVKSIANKQQVGQQIVTLSQEKSMGEEGIELFDEWISLEKFRDFVAKTSVDNLKEVHRSIGVLRDIVGITRENTPERLEGVEVLLRNLMHPNFLKLFTFLLLIPTIRNVVLQFEEPEARETLAAFVKNPYPAVRLQGGESQ